MPRAVDHARRRKILVDALWRVVDRDGIEKATMREIASEAGVSIGMLQHYFADKDEILAVAVRSGQDRYGERVRRLLAALGDDASPREIVLIAVRNRLPLTLRQRRHASVLLHSLRGARTATQMELVNDGERFFGAVLADALATAAERGDVPDDCDVAGMKDALVALSDGLILGLVFGRLDRNGALRAVEAHVGALFAGRRVSNMPY